MTEFIFSSKKSKMIKMETYWFFFVKYVWKTCYTEINETNALSFAKFKLFGYLAVWKHNFE